MRSLQAAQSHRERQKQLNPPRIAGLGHRTQPDEAPQVGNPAAQIESLTLNTKKPRPKPQFDSRPGLPKIKLGMRLVSQTAAAASGAMNV
ncbi:hypothetical protein Ato02nite_074260 [Paractinoplanes toevensis]|uniref:Uncharacterized protein n=1 Tax=Paractinoplanes toevensis TaxID=571911 RepID=A0A919TH90_9ACTN|nr:hypothetical protein Ato02nite_074260 [Actinoplanes toevensis]